MEYVGPNREYAIDTTKEIGKGNYGRVYECQNIQQSQLQQGNLCAKVIAIYHDKNKQLSEKDLDREKQITEIVKNNQLNKNLVKVFHVEHNKQKSVLTVVMEKCPSSLEQEWKKKNIYSEPEIIDFLKQFADGYKALYEKNIIHRDIKPENILIQQEGASKYYRLADFGIGRIYKLNDFKFTKSGTAVFASPELNSLVNDNELDQTFGLMRKQKDVVDMYSLGIILHMLMQGGYPYDLNTVGIKKFLAEIKQNPFKLKANPSMRVANLVERMIVYDPSKRLKFEQLQEEINRLTNTQNPQFATLPYPQQNNVNFVNPIQFPNSGQNNVNFVNPFPNSGQNNVNIMNPVQLPNPGQNNVNIMNPVQLPNPGQNNVNVVNPQQGQKTPLYKQFQSQNPQGVQYQQGNLQQRFTKPGSQQNLLINTQFQINSNNQKIINPHDEICKFLKRCVLIHRNLLNPEHLLTIDRYIGGQYTLINEILKLYNTFDKNYQDYNEDEINFYFCLKQAQLQKTTVPQKSKDEQLADLRG